MSRSGRLLPAGQVERVDHGPDRDPGECGLHHPGGRPPLLQAQRLDQDGLPVGQLRK